MAHRPLHLSPRARSRPKPGGAHRRMNSFGSLDRGRGDDRLHRPYARAHALRDVSQPIASASSDGGREWMLRASRPHAHARSYDVSAATRQRTPRSPVGPELTSVSVRARARARSRRLAAMRQSVARARDREPAAPVRAAPPGPEEVWGQPAAEGATADRRRRRRRRPGRRGGRTGRRARDRRTGPPRPRAFPRRPHRRA